MQEFRARVVTSGFGLALSIAGGWGALSSLKQMIAMLAMDHLLACAIAMISFLATFFALIVGVVVVATAIGLVDDAEGSHNDYVSEAAEDRSA